MLCDADGREWRENKKKLSSCLFLINAFLSSVKNEIATCFHSDMVIKQILFESV